MYIDFGYIFRIVVLSMIFSGNTLLFWGYTSPELGRVKLEVYRCERSGHIYGVLEALKKEEPETCPKCRSPYWNKPRLTGDNKKILLFYYYFLERIILFVLYRLFVVLQGFDRHSVSSWP
jgi:DNA-directed RNA polymerase subunit RPC12/RpoP